MNGKMDKRKEFDNILDECLERVMKGEDIMAVLALYPQYADELEPLLRTALDTKAAVDIAPRPEFRRRAALEFQRAIREMPVKAKAAPGVSHWRMAWVAPLAVFMALIVAGTGTVAAASNSLPDSPLYSVKLATESVRLALTPSSLGKAELYAKFNDKRVAEIVAMAEKGKSGQIEKLTDRLNSNMMAMADLTGGGKTASYGGMNMLLAPAATSPQEESGYEIMETPVPTGTPPLTTEASPETALGAPPQTTIITVPPPAAESQMRSFLAHDSSKEDKNGRNTREGELQELLTEKQAEALRLLYQELEDAPEWLKPQIQRAIDVILGGYNTSISNLAE